MELDRALEYAVMLAWKDLMTGDQLIGARVQYEIKQGTPLDSVSVWTIRSPGYQARVCDYRASSSPTHPIGATFSNEYHSDILAQTLDFIMKNQDQFTLPVDAWRRHFILIQPPGADLVAEAAAWMTQAQDAVANRAAAGEIKAERRTDLRRRSNGAVSDPRIAPVTADVSRAGADNGFPNGPWR